MLRAYGKYTQVYIQLMCCFGKSSLNKKHDCNCKISDTVKFSPLNYTKN